MGTLLREGRREAWFLLLGVLVVGGGLEIILNGPAGLLFQHGFGSNSRPGGMALFAYPVAWVTALAISYRPIFRSGVSSATSVTSTSSRGVTGAENAIWS
jgi:hypothetical protein